MTGNTRPSVDAAAIEARILAFIRAELLTPDVTVHRDDDLLSGEVLDSMSVLRLAAFVGQDFQINVQPADFVVENFRSVATIAAYVRRSLASSDASR
jgi:acyl carrier protein